MNHVAPAGAVPPVIPSFIAKAAPSRERIDSLDVLRGFAVLGILIMNIQGFALITAAYSNPTAYGDFTGVNRWVWLVGHVFADQKFLTIFSLLFGAGIVLFSTHVQNQGRSAAWLHYRRMFWLLVIGLIHAHFFWYGDILISYALTGAVAFLFRTLKPIWLVLLGCAALVVPSLIFLASGLSMPFWPADTLQQFEQEWQPGADGAFEELRAYRGGFLDQLAYRAPLALGVQVILLFLWTGWRAGGLMLIGMALQKWSVLSGSKSARFYALTGIVGAGIGLPLILRGVYRNFQEEWSAQYSFFLGSQWNYFGSLGVALCYVALILLALRSQAGLIRGTRRVFAAVGRMALTNYLLQTLICTTIFYGHGLGWFGFLERWQLALVVLGVWTIQILFTLAWLQRFPRGPFEWLWRLLTYWGTRHWKK